MPERVLITGVSGFVGGHTTLQLLEAGYTVRGNVRDLKKADKGWADAMRDVRYLHHVASPLLLVMPKDAMEFVRPGVE